MYFKPYIRKANYYETDQMGIIHHSNYIRWFEEARTDYMDQLGFGYDKAMEAGIDFMLLNVQCSYKSMVRFNDIVKIIPSISQLSPSRMTITYQIINVKSEELCCIGSTSHCYFDNAKQRPVSLKRRLNGLYSLFESSIN